jgi:hypothetical protein
MPSACIRKVQRVSAAVTTRINPVLSSAVPAVTASTSMMWLASPAEDCKLQGLDAAAMLSHPP